MRGPIKSLFIISLLISILSTSSIAADWRVSPIRLGLSPSEKSTSVTVYNDGSESVNFQVKVMKWTQDSSGKDIYTETDDLIYFPRIFTLEGGKQRVIRVGLKKAVQNLEETYRIFIEEIPSAEKKEGVAIRIALKFGIPIFVKPLKEEIKWEITRKEIKGGIFTFEIGNKGNCHFFIDSLKLTGFKGGQEIFNKKINGWYVLSGAKRVFNDKIEHCSNIDSMTINLTGEGIAIDEKIEVREENCNP